MGSTDSKKKIIANRIRLAREMSGLSQGQVAKMLGLHRPSISEAEAGNRAVTADEIVRMAEIYDVPAAWLLGEGAEQLDPNVDRMQLAARELTKLRPEDQERLFKLLAPWHHGEKKK
jgi:transcriptional regulator with XRE-family HTH domain